MKVKVYIELSTVYDTDNIKDYPKNLVQPDTGPLETARAMAKWDMENNFDFMCSEQLEHPAITLVGYVP